MTVITDDDHYNQHGHGSPTQHIECKHSPGSMHATLGLCVSRHHSRFGAALESSPKLRTSRHRGFVQQQSFAKECEQSTSGDASPLIFPGKWMCDSETCSDSITEGLIDFVSPKLRYLPGVGRRVVLRRSGQACYKLYDQLQREPAGIQELSQSLSDDQQLVDSPEH